MQVIPMNETQQAIIEKLDAQRAKCSEYQQEALENNDGRAVTYFDGKRSAITTAIEAVNDVFDGDDDLGGGRDVHADARDDETPFRTDENETPSPHRLSEDLVLVGDSLQTALYKANRYQGLGAEYDHLLDDTLEAVERLRDMANEILKRYDVHADARPDRRYLAFTSDGDQTDTDDYIGWDEAIEWATTRLSELEESDPGTDHYVQIISYRPEAHPSYPDSGEPTPDVGGE